MGLPSPTGGDRPDVVKGRQSLIGYSEFETTLKLKNGKVSFPSSAPVNRNGEDIPSPSPHLPLSPRPLLPQDVGVPIEI